MATKITKEELFEHIEQQKNNNTNNSPVTVNGITYTPKKIGTGIIHGGKSEEPKKPGVIKHEGTIGSAHTIILPSGVSGSTPSVVSQNTSTLPSVVPGGSPSSVPQTTNTPAVSTPASSIDARESARLDEVDLRYSGLLDESNKIYSDIAKGYSLDNPESFASVMMQLQEAKTEQAISEINSKKKLAEKDYEKEKKAAYVDWKRQSDPYGANAEARATNGLTSSGYSETVQARMYSDYQTRLISARESFVRAETEFATAIASARLQNSAALAQIAFDSFQKQCEYILSGLTARQGLLSSWAAERSQIIRDHDTLRQNEIDNKYREDAFNFEKEQQEKDNIYRENAFNFEKEQQEKDNIYRENAFNFEKEQQEKDNIYRDEALALDREQLNLNWAKLDADKQGDGGLVFDDNFSSVMTYNEALSVLKSNGVQNTDALMSEGEYNSAKANGEDVPETYSLYLQDYVSYALETSAGKTNNSPFKNDSEYETWVETFDKEGIKNFLYDVVMKSVYYNPNGLDKTELEDLIKQNILNNTELYDIDINDAKRILNKFGFDTSWLSDYRDRWGINSKKGMIEK